jgi:hypothetical protein
VAIMKVDKYMGYIAFAKFYLPQKLVNESMGLGILEDLIGSNPSRPEAYLVLWNYYVEKENHQMALEIGEQCFIMSQHLKSMTIKNLLAIIYAESLAQNKEHVACFQFL